MLFHCIYLHSFFPRKVPQKELWELALDICCESAVSRLEPKDFDGKDSKRNLLISQIEKNVQMMLPELVYQELINGSYDLDMMQELFRMDDHLWLVESGHLGDDALRDGQAGGKNSYSEERQREWRNVGQKVAADLKSFHKQGKNPGAFVQEIEYLTEDKMTYDEFLRKFAVTEE